MSSRSFRRRNNRRRHRSSPNGEGLEQRAPEAAEAAGPADQRGPGAQIPTDPSRDQRPAEGRRGREGDPRREGGQRRGGQKQDQGRRRGGGRQDGGQIREGRQSGRGSPVRALEEEAPPRPAVPLVVPDCPVCGKPVRELASALTHRVSRQPAHFDCVVRELRESNEIAPQEKLCYLGDGCFGILEFKAPGGPSRFVIKRRIQYEEKEAPQDWKKPLQISC